MKKSKSPRAKWTEQDDTFLFKYNGILGRRQIGQALRRTEAAVNSRVMWLKENNLWEKEAVKITEQEPIDKSGPKREVEAVDEETLIWYVRRAKSNELTIMIDGLGTFKKR